MTYPDEMVLIRSTHAPYGGVERVALSLINGLLEKGVRIRVLTVRGQQWPVSHPNLKFVHLGMPRGHRLVKAWAFNHAVNRYLDRAPCRCVLALDKVTRFTHLHAGGGTHKSFLAIKKRYCSPLARFFLHVSPFHHYMIHLERKGFENQSLEKVRCNSKMVMKIVEHDYGVARNKLVLVHSGIRWREMQHAFDHRQAEGADLCRRHGLDPQWKSLLFLGSGFRHKGLDLAITGLGAMSSDYHLVVVGKGADRPFRRMAASLGLDGRVHFLGPQPEGWRFASFCKAVVLPSHYDPFGGASAEGHAMGLPVLVSDKTGYADWVTDGLNGVVLQTPMTVPRVEAGFAALERMIEHPEWSPEQLRSHARNVDDEVVLERLLEAFFGT